MMTTTFPWPMPTWMWTMLLDLITCDFDQGCYGYLVLWKLMTWVDIASPSLLAMDSPMRGAARTEIVCKTTAAGQRCSKRFLADFCCCPIVPPFHLSKKIKKAHQILKKKHTHHSYHGHHGFWGLFLAQRCRGIGVGCFRLGWHGLPMLGYLDRNQAIDFWKLGGAIGMVLGIWY